MRPTEQLQEIWKMRFEESFSIWTEGQVESQSPALDHPFLTRKLNQQEL